MLGDLFRRRQVPRVLNDESSRFVNRLVQLSLAAAASLAITTQLHGQACQKYPDIDGCGLQPQQCFPVASGPTSWQDPGAERTWQYRRAIQSPTEPSCEGVLGESIPSCCGGKPPSNGPDPSIAIRVVGTRVLIDYDAPGNYCTNDGDWPPFFTCTNDAKVDVNHLTISDAGGVLRAAFLYFEHGTWDTGIDIPCGQTASYSGLVSFAVSPSGAKSATTALTPLTGTCFDRRECGGGGGTSVGLPINVGSGDVMVRQPLFAIAQEPASLPFTMTYHSSAPMFPSLISEPIGRGWTHEYNQV